MGLLDPISPEDMKALGDSLGNAVGQHLRAALQTAVADALASYKSLDYSFTLSGTLRLNKPKD